MIEVNVEVCCERPSGRGRWARSAVNARCSSWLAEEEANAQHVTLQEAVDAQVEVEKTLDDQIDVVPAA